MTALTRNIAAFTAEIDVHAADASLPFGVRLGMAVRMALSRNASLSGADLRGANLSGANLSDADWIPRVEGIHHAVLAAATATPAALDMRTWHRGGYCGTTHCRAGWVVVLAGAAGRAMEGLMGTGPAAALIYQASDPTMERVPNWHATNEDALADMKRMADAEAIAKATA